MKQLFRRALPVYIFSFFAVIGGAQSNLAGISGVTTDPSNGSIPDALVTVVNAQTGVAATARTNSSGYYSVENLAIGAYTITIERTGFRKYVRENITLTTGQQLGLDVHLQVGDTSGG